MHPYFIGVPLPAIYSIELFQITHQMSVQNGCLDRILFDEDVVPTVQLEKYWHLIKVSISECQPGHI